MNQLVVIAPQRPEVPAPLGRNAALLAVGALTIMAGATISPSLPAIEAHFVDHPNGALLTRLVLTIPALAVAAAAPFAGAIADRFGRRPLLIAAVLLYALAGMSGLVLNTLEGLLVGRVLLGLSVAGTMTVATALAGDYFAGPSRDRFMGYQSAAIGASGLLFLTGGGLLAELHWRAPFALYGLALLLLPAVLILLPEPRRPSARRGIPGPADRLLPGAGLALVAILAAAFLNSAAFYLVPTQLPFRLQELGATPSQAGIAVGIVPLAGAVTSLLYQRLRQRLSVPAVFAFAFGVMTLGFELLGSADSYAAIVFGVAVMGGGMGFVMPNLSSGAMTIAPARWRGRVAGGLTAAIFLGQFPSPFMSQPLIAAYGFAGAALAAGFLTGGLALWTLAIAVRRSLRSRARHNRLTPP